MSKIPLPQDKETVIGIGLFVGVFILFLVNIFMMGKTLIDVYAAKPKQIINKTVEASVIAEAIKILSDVKEKN